MSRYLIGMRASFFKSLFTGVGGEGALKKKEQEKKKKREMAKRKRSREGREAVARERGQTSNTGQRGKAAATVMVRMFAWESREKWQIRRAAVFFFFQHNGQLPLFLDTLTERGLKSFTKAAKVHWRTAETATVQIAVLILQMISGTESMWRQNTTLTWNPKLWERCSLTEPYCSRLIFSEKEKKSRSETCACTYTLHGLRIAAKWSQLWLHPTAV